MAVRPRSIAEEGSISLSDSAAEKTPVEPVTMRTAPSDEDEKGSGGGDGSATDSTDERGPPAAPPLLGVVPPSPADPEDADRASRRPSTSGTADTTETYPEGGLRAWLVVFGCWLALLASLGIMNTLATFQTYLIAHQLSDYGAGTVGWIFSTYTFIVFFLGLYVGPLFDKYGPRCLLLAGTLCLVAGLMLFSISTELWHFILSFGLVTGLGCSLLFTPSFAAPGHFFQRRRGLATGLAATGGSAGGIAFPFMLEALLPRLGWTWSIRALCLACLVLCAGANLLVRRRLQPAHNASAHPDFRIFRSRPFLFTTAGIFLLELALFIPITYVSSYARAAGFSPALSFRILPILNAGSALGRAIPGYFGDRVGPFNVNLAMVVLSIIACLAVWLPAGSYTAGLVVFAVLFGFASGSNVSITPVCIGRLCMTQNYGRYYATCYTIVSFACLVGVPIGGNIITRTGGAYWGVIVFTGCAYVGSFGFLAAAKVYSVGWKPLAIF